MEDTTLFVLPPSPAFLCPIHGGLLQLPVTNGCGHSFCQSCVLGVDVCPEDDVPLKNYIPNTKLQVEIDSLWCYCRFGVIRSSSGKLIPNTKGCSAILQYGDRLAHEATCDFQDEKDFVFVDSPSTSPRPIKIPDPPKRDDPAPLPVPALEVTPNIVLVPCPNKDDGCFFLADSNEELATHLSNECTYERLRRQIYERDAEIEFLKQELAHRDEEIVNMKKQMAQIDDEVVFIQPDPSPFDMRAKELWDDIVKLFGEEIPSGLNNARDSVVRQSSAALQKSSSTFTLIKSKFSRKTDEMKQEINDLHPIDKLIAVLTSLKEEVLSSVRESLKKPTRTIGSPTSTSTQHTQTPDENDPELKQHLEASLKSFEEEKQKRLEAEQIEAAAIAAAAAESLANAVPETNVNETLC